MIEVWPTGNERTGEREQSIEILKKIVGERIEERTKGNRMKR